MKHIALIALAANLAHAHTSEPDAFSPLVVSALRFEQTPADATSAVTVLDPEELREQGIYTLQDALNLSPGVISTSTAGQTGSVGSLFIRGTTTGYSQMLVDGIRLSDSTTPLGNMLGAGRTFDLGRIEILRGPHGAIYGGESVGGVLWLETPRGTGQPTGELFLEGGSFGSYTGYTKFQGTAGPMSYFLGGGYEATDNDGANEHFHQASAAMRVEAALDDKWTLGTTYRAIDSYFENAGASVDHLDAALATLYANGRISDVWTTRFLAGYRQEFYDSDSSFGNFGTDLRSAHFSTDQEINLTDDLRLLAGAFLQESSFENTIGTDESRTRYGAHTALEWEPIEALTTTAALRWEDYDEFGDELTWRAGAAYRVKESATTIRGGIGSSFRAPTYVDLFGSSFGAGNPNLDPETSLGWDIGVVQEICKSHSIGVTFFANRIEDQIQSFPTPPVNLPGATDTNGIELGANGRWENPAIQYRLAWTWLHESLSDQPRNAATASLGWNPTDRLLVGIGATHLADRSWGGNPVAAYTTARLFGSYELTERVKLHARVENALDEDYEQSDFFGTIVEGQGTGVYAGVTIDW